MNPILTTRTQEIEQIILSEEEISYALWQAKYVKWQKKKNEDDGNDCYKAGDKKVKEDEQREAH